MNWRTRSFALIVLCVVVVVLLFWQRTQITNLRQRNAELRTQLTEVQRQPVYDQGQPTVTPSPEPEMLRLRAEVAELRRKQAEFAQSNSMPRAAKVSAVNEAEELPFEIRDQHNTLFLKNFVLAMLMIIAYREEQKAGGKLEILDADGTLTPDLRRETEKLLKEGDEANAVDLDKAWRDVELLITDAADLAKLDPNTIVARSVAMKMPNGKWRRVYAFADGSAHRRVHESPDEIWQAPSQ